jgi:hypothetical protein
MHRPLKQSWASHFPFSLDQVTPRHPEVLLEFGFLDFLIAFSEVPST